MRKTRLLLGKALGLSVVLAVACGSGGSKSGSELETTGSGGNASGPAGTTGPGSGVGGVILSGGTSSTGGSNEGGEAGDSFEECAGSEEDGSLTPANLLFVVDRSGSMNCNPPEFGQTSQQCEITPEKLLADEPSKWEITRDALSAALDDLAAQPNVNAGVVVFPAPDTQNQCAVATEPDVPIKRLSSSHRQEIADFLEGVDPKGKTPIAGSTILSYRFLSEQLKAGDLAGNTFLVLLTDGADTCELSDSGVIEHFVDTDVPNATLFNIRTFVIGAPGSEGARRLLSEIAFNGNTARDQDCDHTSDSADEGDCHFDMTTTDDFAAELGNALSDISSDKSLSCVFDVPKNEKGAGVNLNQVNVTFVAGSGDSTKVYRDDSEPCDGGAEGWQYSDDRTQILLCGGICDSVRNDAGGQLTIVLGCPTEVLK